MYMRDNIVIPIGGFMDMAVFLTYILPVMILTSTLCILLFKVKSRTYIHQTLLILNIGLICSLIPFGLFSLFMCLPALIVMAIFSPALLKKD